MGAILIGMPKHEDALRIADLIRNGGITEECMPCQTGSEILRKAEEYDASLVICIKHFSDMGFLAESVCRECDPAADAV